MPPKKDKKNAKEKEDHSVVEEGPPTNDVAFKIKFTAKHEGGHFLKLKFNWFEKLPDGTIEQKDHDTGYFKDWSVRAIDGDEPTLELTEDEGSKTLGKGKSPAAATKGGKGAIPTEEVTDNRPRLVEWESGEEGFKALFNDKMAHYFETFLLKISVVELSRETNEDGPVLDSITLDLSALLFETEAGKSVVQFSHSKWLVQPLWFLNVEIKVDKPLLSDFFRKKLNPLLISLLGCKSLPYSTDPKFKPIYSVFKFLDGRSFRTRPLPQQPDCKFKHKHVFLVGHMDHIALQEDLLTQVVTVEVHNNEVALPNPEDDQQVFSIGRARFSFRDLLMPTCSHLKLRADIFPLKREEIDNSLQLDLNTTAKKNEQQAEKASPYLHNGSYSTLTVRIARPIGPFLFQEELQTYRESQKSAMDTEHAPSQAPPLSQTSPKSIDIRDNSKMDSKMGSKLESESDVHFHEAVFNRLIILIPYKSPDVVQQIDEIFERINLKGIGLPNLKYLNTKEFTKEERKDRSLDFLGGFALMDHDTRMYILEGLGGDGHAIDLFYKVNMRKRPNDKKFTIIYNPDIRFKERLYLDFNAVIRKIKLREPLRRLMAGPDVYLRSKVPDSVFQVLSLATELRKVNRMVMAKNFNLFPSSDQLVILENKYGDALSFEDLYGKPKKPKKKAYEESTTFSDNERSQDPTRTISTAGKRNSLKVNQTLTVTLGSHLRARRSTINSPIQIDQSGLLRRGPKRKADTDCVNADFELHLQDRFQSPEKNFQSINLERMKSMSHGKPPRERMQLPEGVDAFLYSNQRLNIWEFQKEKLREQVGHDPSKFYTYSNKYLSQAFPLVDEQEAAIREREESEARWKSKNGFDTLNKNLNWNEHPKRPAQSTIEALKIPHHVQAAHTKNFMDKFRFKKREGQLDFQPRVPGIDLFSDKGYFKTVLASGESKDEELKALRKKQEEEFNAKLVVASPTFKVNTFSTKKGSQLDRLKNIREGSAMKISLRHSNKRLSALQDRGIAITKAVEPPPVSMLKQEDYIRKGYISPFKAFDRSKSVSVNDFNTAINGTYLEQSPLSKHVRIRPIAVMERKGHLWNN